MFVTHDFRYFYLNLGCPHGVMVKVMDRGIVVNEFIFQSRYYVHFWANTLGKGMNSLIPPRYGLNSTTTVLWALVLNNLQRLICH